VSLKGNFDPEMQVDQLLVLSGCWHSERMSVSSDAEKKSHFSLENDLNNKYGVCCSGNLNTCDALLNV
jgi:hypothetical protein